MSLLEEDISYYQKQVGKNITTIMASKNITQEKIRMLCQQAGYPISQATISNAKNGKGNLTLSNLVALAYALEVNVADLLALSNSHSDSCNPPKKGSDSAFDTTLFLRDPNSIFFKGYLGKYYTLFYKTSGTEDELVKGTLHFQESEDKKRCKAVLKFLVNDLNRGTGKVTEKIYEGELVISHTMHAAYCYLTSTTVGEICMLVFQHIFTSYSLVNTIMAAAITTASGANRRPTVHRMCISRTPVGDEMLEYVKGQLLMNTADIYLADSKLKQLLQRQDIPVSFKELLQKGMQKGKCYCIPEASLYDISLDEIEQQKLVSLVRANSQAPKYNKISKRTDEILYTLIGCKNQNP